MTIGLVWARKGLRRTLLACGLAVGLTAAAGAPPSFAQPSATAAFTATVNYVAQFYPLWFTYYQTLIGRFNVLVGPNHVSPIYHVVVAINVDTLYASSFLDVSNGPVILTIPKTSVSYSILTLDTFGNTYDDLIPPATAGVFALTNASYTGAIPAGATQVKLPLNHMTFIVRADKQPAEGAPPFTERDTEAFRTTIMLQPMSDYTANPTGGATAILPEIIFIPPFKNTADNLIARDPIKFLKQLQVALHAGWGQTLTPAQQAANDRFDALFGDGDLTNDPNRFEFAAGAQAAHNLIVTQYTSHTGPTNWINFTNIGTWGNHALERSGITEYIQYANNHSAAAYYHTFTDWAGRALDGTDPRGYVLTFPKRNLPQAKRFWSLTAYTPDSVELIRNSARKYNVASYTKGLKYNADGSLSIYMARTQPAGVPAANWLPVAPGKFNVMLRFYGVEGEVEQGTYLPPAVRRP